MGKRVKIGWVGVRGYGEKFWDHIKNSSFCDIRVCYHKERSVAEEASNRMQCEFVLNFDDLINSPKVDALILTVPNDYHYDYAKLALEAGKHVLVEKPLTNSVREGRILFSTALEKHLVLSVGHNYRKNNFIEKIKEELEKGRIGLPVAAEFNMGHGGGLKFGPDQWRFHKSKCPGGPLNMLGTHMIDAANYLFGKPKYVQGTVKNMYANTTAEDMSLIQIHYSKGVVVNIVNLYNSVSTEFINVYGTEGALRFTRWPVCGLWYQAKDINCDCATYESIEYIENNAQKEIFEDFVKAITNQEPCQSNAQESLEVIRVMEAALKAHQDGRKMEINF